MNKVLQECPKYGDILSGKKYYVNIGDIYIFGDIVDNKEYQFIAARNAIAGFLFEDGTYIDELLAEDEYKKHIPSKDDEQILITIAEAPLVAPYWSLMGDIGKRLNEKWKRGETPPDFHSDMEYIAILQRETEERLEVLKEKRSGLAEARSRGQ